jgi:hypothetical protein
MRRAATNMGQRSTSHDPSLGAQGSARLRHLVLVQAASLDGARASGCGRLEGSRMYAIHPYA